MKQIQMKECLRAFIETFDTFGQVLGVQLVVEEELLDEEIDALIQERNKLEKIETLNEQMKFAINY